MNKTYSERVKTLRVFTRSGMILLFILIGLAASLSSCDGIYDDPSEQQIAASDNQFLYLDCRSYTEWLYISLHTRDTITLHYKETEVPFDWDIAIHRYDIKTNQGAAIQTPYYDLDELQRAIDNNAQWISTIPNLWIEDTEGDIHIDLSKMLEGYIEDESVFFNKELTKWLDVNLIQMPPIYTPSNRVYLVRLKDNTIAALKFTNFANPYHYNAKGFISFDYIYPLDI